jgi:hypothetical protein
MNDWHDYWKLYVASYVITGAFVSLSAVGAWTVARWVWGLFK